MTTLERIIVPHIAVPVLMLLCLVAVLVIAQIMRLFHNNQIRTDSYQAHIDALEKSDSKKETNDV